MMIQSFSAETIIIIRNVLVLTANIILIKVLISIILAVRTRKLALVYLFIYFLLINMENATPIFAHVTSYISW